MQWLDNIDYKIQLVTLTVQQKQIFLHIQKHTNMENETEQVITSTKWSKKKNNLLLSIFALWICVILIKNITVTYIIHYWSDTSN